MALLLALSLLAVAGWLWLAAAANAAESGGISGKVTSAATDEPIAGIEVCASGRVAPYAYECAKTDNEGKYTVPGLSANQYTVSFAVPYTSSLNYLTQYYKGKSSYTEAEPVSVAAGGTTSSIDAAMVEGGEISGKVTAASTSTALAGIEVCASGGSFRCTTTAADGTYTVSALTAGEYRVEFAVPYKSGLNYLRQYYSNKASSAEADSVAVMLGSKTAGIDAAMHEGGQLAGHVTASGSKTPLAGIEVCANKIGEFLYRCGTTDSEGAYTVAGLATGEYKVSFVSGSSDYLTQYYKGKATFEAADAVNATAGSTTSEIDAALIKSGHVTGRITDSQTSAPLANIGVCAELRTLGAPFTRCAGSGADGSYDITGLEAGQYRVSFYDGSQKYLTQYFNGRRSLAQADIVSVTAGATTEEVDAAMVLGAVIKGEVTDATTMVPVAGITACALATNSSGETECAITNESGEYTIRGLVGSTYDVAFNDSAANYVDQAYNGKPSLSGAQVFSLSPGEEVTGINAKLAAGGKITGKVTDNTSGAPISGIAVFTYNPDGSYAGVFGATTNTLGEYVRAVPTGEYKVQFYSFSSEHQSQYYNDKTTFFNADPVKATVGSSTAHIDAALLGPGPVNTARPTISGDIGQGRTLTEHAGSWEGSPTKFSYQWLRCNSSGSNCAQISGATSQSYVVGGADGGRTIEVEETATNGNGSNRAVSLPTSVVPPLAPVSTAAPTIVGVAEQGQTLTEHPGTWENNPTEFSYQWLRCDESGNGCLDIKTATGQTYIAVGADVGHTLEVQEVAKNTGGSSAPAVSKPTAVVLPPKPVNETPPTITGTPDQGEMLTEHHGKWQNKPTEYEFQWFQCDSLGAGCLSIPGATEQIYVPTAFDVEHTLRVAETAINSAGSSEPSLSAATAAVTTAAPVNSSPPKIVGIARPGEALVVSPGSWSNEPARTGEQWLRCDASGEACASITGAGESSYLVSADDLSHTLRVEETASNEGGAGVPARSLPTAKVASGPLQAVAGEDLETTVGTSVTLDGSGSTPSSEIGNYHWDFGDGTQASGAIVQHSYKATGHYTATLTVGRGGETSQQSISVTVIHPEHETTITVQDENHQPLAGAEVLYIGANNVRIEATTDGAGEAYLAGLPDRTDTVYAVKLPGYLPAVGQVNVSGGGGEATITLKQGELGEAKLEEHEMNRKEIEEAGIDVNDPANQNVYSFQIALHFKCQINGAGEFVGLERCTGGGGGGGGGWTSHGICKEGTCISGGAIEEHPFIKELKLQGTVTTLKQFFAVKLVVYNLSPKQFAFTHGQATLNVPAGMSLAPTPVLQSAAQSVADIPGEGSAQANWIIRGDQPGEYYLSASYHGQLEPFEKPFELLASSTEPLKVWGAEAFGFHVQADEGSLKEGVPYHVRIGVYDKAPIPFYNVAISLSEAHEHFIFQPDQQFTAQVSELKPGETIYAPQDILVPDANGGTFDPGQSYARFVGEAVHPGEGIEAVSPPPLYSMSASLESITLVHLYWQPSPGAEGYEVFSTPNLDTPFAAGPDAVQTSPSNKATVTRLPASATDAWIPRGANDPPRFYAVSSIIGGNLRLEHPVKEPSLQGPVGGPLTLRELLAGGHNLSEFCVDCFLSDHLGFVQPVDAPTGNFWHSFTDFNIPGRGLPLNLTRTYNSGAASTNGPFGYGWSFPYGMNLGFPDPTHAVITQENGATVEFGEEAGKWVAPPRVTAALSHNGDGSWTFVRRKRETFTFDSGGRLTAERDLNGYITSLAYNEKGELKTVTDPAGRKLKLAWKKGHVASVTDPLKRTISYEYNGAGDLADVTDVAGGNTHFTYDSQHRMLSMRLPNQAPGVPGSTEAALHNTYDEQGRVTTQTDQLGRETSFEYAGEPLGEAGGTATITDSKGNIVRQTYQYGLLMSETRGYSTAEAATWQFEYDLETLGMTAVTDPNGHVSKASYDAEGNILTSEDALGRKTANTYDALNDELTTTDPLGITTSLTYDGHGNLLKRERPLTGTSQVETTAYTYGDAAHPGDVTAMIDPVGRVWRYGYDKYGDRISAADPLYDMTTSTYNADGWKLTEASPRGKATGKPSEYTTTYSYNGFGQVVKTVDPLGHTATNEYDPDQNLIATIDPAGNAARYEFDAADERIAEHRANGSTTETKYWPDGSVEEQIDAAGHATRYDYNALGQATAVTDSRGRTTHYSYDGVGNRLSITNPEGQGTTMTYDAANEHMSTSYSDGKTPDVSGITYDGDGQRIAETDGSASWSWHWDSLHRLTSVTEGNNGTVSYSYDLRGLPIEITYPNGKTVKRAYDGAGRLTSVVDWKHDATTFKYDADGNETQQTAAGVVDSFVFDRSDQMPETSDKAGTSVLFAAKYARNANSQVTTDSSAAAGKSNYGYTALNQLCYAGSSPGEPCTKPPSGASSYAYDNADNLTQNDATSETFDAANELCWAGSGSGSCSAPPAGATTYSYNERGDRTGVKPSSGPSTVLGYDQADRLTRFVLGSTSVSYAYNGDGLRMSKTLGKKSTAFAWDVAEELPLLLQAGKSSYIYGPDGLPIEQITGAKSEWLHHDQTGSTRLTRIMQ
jgi:YD repeat-containing protein